MTSGIVFNIQPYSLHDGSGIRTIAFLKGCPLRCIWCCNPESQDPLPEVYFDSEKCIRNKGCKFCGGVCDISEYPEKLSAEFPTLKKRVRTPVIPTVNDSEKDIHDIKRLVSGISGCTHELLPYHRFGVRKYELLGRRYADIPDRLDDNIFERLKELH